MTDKENRVRNYEQQRQAMLAEGYMEFTGTISILKANVSFLVSIVVHEGIHGLTWGLCCPKHFKSIRFGIMKESLTPYCHCMEPLKCGAYFMGALMPFLVLGIGLFAVSLFIQNSIVLFLSILNILCAGGDTTIVLMLRKHIGGKILDHPTDCGFVAFEKREGEVAL